ERLPAAPPAVRDAAAAGPRDRDPRRRVAPSLGAARGGGEAAGTGKGPHGGGARAWRSGVGGRHDGGVARTGVRQTRRPRRSDGHAAPAPGAQTPGDEGGGGGR